MIENIRLEFIEMLKEADWMDKKSKEQALDKADFMDSKVGYPDFIYNNTHLNFLYRNVNFFLKNKIISYKN